MPLCPTSALPNWPIHNCLHCTLWATTSLLHHWLPCYPMKPNRPLVPFNWCWCCWDAANDHGVSITQAFWAAMAFLVELLKCKKTKNKWTQLIEIIEKKIFIIILKYGNLTNATTTMKSGHLCSAWCIVEFGTDAMWILWVRSITNGNNVDPHPIPKIVNLTKDGHTTP